jgi:hypothetical protein
MAEIPSLIVTERRAHIDIFKEVETGQCNGNVVLDTILPVSEKVFFQDIFFFCRNGVPHIGGIIEPEILIPFWRALPVFEFKGIEFGHIKSQFRK